MDKLVIGVFEDANSAAQAVNDFREANLDKGLTVAARDEHQDYIETGVNKVKGINTDSSTNSAVAGSVLGGVVGFLAGVSAIGLTGGVVVVGTLATTLLGLASGATIGALAGAINQLGLSEEQANQVTNHIEQGHIALIAQTDESRTEEARQIINRNNGDLLNF
jgi:uncharacterized membrane protein